MNEDKHSRIMLNISLGFMAAYCALFLGGYYLQYEYWILGYSDMAMSFPTEIPRVYSPVIIGSVLLFSAVTIVLGILLKRHSSSALCIGAAVFALCAFTSDRLIKGLVPGVITRSMAVEGVNGVALAGYHANSVHFLDMLLLPLFAVSLTLMVCVCCNKRVNMIRKEYYNG